MKKRIICINKTSTYVIEKLNETVRTNVDLSDKIGKTKYMFWGPKITENEFLWKTAKHVNNNYKVKGEIVAKDDLTTEINIDLVRRPSCYIFYVLVVCWWLIAVVSESLPIAIFSIVFIILAYGGKMNYFDDVERDIKNIFK